MVARLEQRGRITRLGDAATFLLVLLHYTKLLQSLEDLAVNGARAMNVMTGSNASVLGSTVRLAQAATLSQGQTC